MDWIVALVLGAIVILAVVLMMLGKRDRSIARHAPNFISEPVAVWSKNIGDPEQDKTKTAEKGPESK